MLQCIPATARNNLITVSLSNRHCRMSSRSRLIPLVVVVVLQLMLLMNDCVVAPFSLAPGVVPFYYLSPIVSSSRSSIASSTSSSSSSLSSSSKATTTSLTLAASSRFSNPTNNGESVEGGELLGQSLILDNYILPASHPLHSLVRATSAACSFEDAIARTSATTSSSSSSSLSASSSKSDTDDDNVDINNKAKSASIEMTTSGGFIGSGEVNAHESFRYEWGTWLSAEKLGDITNALEEIRMIYGGLDSVLSSTSIHHESEDSITRDDQQGNGKRIRIAGGKYWDIILHDLPRKARFQHKWPEGSWTIIQPLTGLVEIAQLRGPGRDGYYTKMRPKDIRGGGDGSGALGSGGGDVGVGGSFGTSSTNNIGIAYSTAGEGCVKYLGGPLRSYSGKAMRSTILEVTVRPPIDVNIDAAGVIDELPWDSVEKVFTRVIIVEPTPEEAGERERGDISSAKSNQSTKGYDTSSLHSSTGEGLNKKLGMEFENVGGLDKQLDEIARRVLASRANPAVARRLGVSHVRGILLSGPPGCGKTLLARELSRILGAREPQIVNGPEILDKFIGEAERRVRELFLPAEREYEEVGDASALHLIIFDELDAVARKRGSMTSDTTGVRDSVVNQLLAKIDGVRSLPNILIVGLTNRPELIDPALLRPGRLEVQLRVELPDRRGRRDILAIHTRGMRQEKALSNDAIDLLDDMGDDGMGARTEHFSGAELAGLVRSAASFALARTVEAGQDLGEDGGLIAADLERALKEVRPALGTQDEVLKLRYPFGISDCSLSMKRIKRDLTRFTAPIKSSTPRLYSLLLVGAGGTFSSGGAGVTALASNAASESSMSGHADFVRFITALDVLTAEGGGGDEARAAALAERFSEARDMSHSLLVLDDIDQTVAGSGPGGYSSVMLSTLRALIRTPPPNGDVAIAGGQKASATGKTLHIIATTSRADAACSILNEIFEELIVVPLLSDVESVETLLRDCLPNQAEYASKLSKVLIGRLGTVGCKTALRLVERAIFTAGMQGDTSQISALESILDDLARNEALASKVCELV